MRTHFSLRHAFALAVIVCLFSVVAGATLAHTGGVDAFSTLSANLAQTTPTGYDFGSNVYPPATTPTTVPNTNQYFAWPLTATAGANWFNIAWYSSDRGKILDVGWYGADDNQYIGYQDGICNDSYCVAYPGSDLSIATDGTYLFAPFDVEVWVYAISYNESTGTSTLVMDWTRVTEFNIGAQSMTLDPVGFTATGPGYPRFSVPDVVHHIPDPDTGLSENARVDWYRMYLIPSQGSISRSVFGSAIDVWVSLNTFTCDGTDCDLNQIFSRLYNGNFQVWVQGYSSALGGYTPWFNPGGPNGLSINAGVDTLANTFLIHGAYNQVGPSSFSPNPGALTSTWWACGATVTGVQTAGEPVCVNDRPLIHFTPDASNIGVEWVNVILYSPTDGSIPLNNWYQVPFSTFNTATGAYFQCGYGYGGGAYPWRTCFASSSALDPDHIYQAYFQAYATGGFATGGLAGTYTDPAAYEDGDGASFAEFSISTFPGTRVRPMPE